MKAQQSSFNFGVRPSRALIRRGTCRDRGLELKLWKVLRDNRISRRATFSTSSSFPAHIAHFKVAGEIVFSGTNNPGYYLERINKLIDGVEKRGGDASLIRLAAELAWEGHRGIARMDKKHSYFVHPLEVAETLLEWGLGEIEIAAGLLHDMLEDGHLDGKPVTKEILRNAFKTFPPEKVDRLLLLIDGVTELGKEEDYDGKSTPPVVSIYRKFLQYGSGDLAIILIKLADRLHNMRTLEYMPETKQEEKAEETLNVFVPLSDALGIWDLKRDLEDLSFKYLHPEIYHEIKEKRKEIVENSEKDLDETLIPLKKKLKESEPEVKVHKEKRGVYELYDRIKKRKEVSIENLSATDIWRINIEVPSGVRCLSLVDDIHSWRTPVKGEFHDFINDPCPNGHKFIQTYVNTKTNLGELLIQIRDYWMNQNYHRGFLSKIKDQPKWYKQNPLWLTAMHRSLEEAGLSTKEAYSMIAAHAFPIKVYTPKKEEIELPYGATVLDFARKIHEIIFLGAQSAFVKGRPTSIFQTLTHGDSVQIKTVERIQMRESDIRPGLDWFDHIHTPEAAAALRKYLRRRPFKDILEDGFGALNLECEGIYITGKRLLESKLFDKWGATFKKQTVAKAEIKEIFGEDDKSWCKYFTDYTAENLIFRENFEEFFDSDNKAGDEKAEEKRKKLFMLYAKSCRTKRTISWLIGIGEVRAKDIVEELRNLYFRLLRKESLMYKRIEYKKQSRFPREFREPYFVSLGIERDTKGPARELTNAFYEMDFNISDISTEYLGRGRKALVLGIDVVGGREGGGIVGDFERLQVDTIIEKVKNKFMQD